MWTIVVAGGTGERFGRPKQYELLDDSAGDRPLTSGGRTQPPTGVVVVVPAADVEREHGVAGGATRSESVRAGLAAVPAEATIICVHDAARPFATLDLYSAGDRRDSRRRRRSDPGIEVTDTIKVVGRQRRCTGNAGPVDPGRGADPAGVPCVQLARRPRPGEARPPTMPRSSRRSVAESSWLPASRPTGRSPRSDDLEWAAA